MADLKKCDMCGKLSKGAPIGHRTMEAGWYRIEPLLDAWQSSTAEVCSSKCGSEWLYAQELRTRQHEDSGVASPVMTFITFIVRKDSIAFQMDATEAEQRDQIVAAARALDKVGYCALLGVGETEIEELATAWRVTIHFAAIPEPTTVTAS